MLKDKLAAWTAARLPWRVVFFAGVRLWQHVAAITDQRPDKVRLKGALELWERTHSPRIGEER